MPNIAATFRQEITRLARKETRAQMRGLRKASAKYRQDIARLKRDAKGLLAELSRLRRQAGREAASQTGSAEPLKVRFRAKGVVAHRKRLGLSAADFGKLVGVTGHTVYKWEHGAARPRNAQLTTLASIRGLGRREAAARLGEMRAKKPMKRRAKR